MMENRGKAKARVIAFANQKGGTGKSTSCAAVAEGLSRRGFRILVIDLDPQGNLSFTMGCDMTKPSADTLLDGATANQGLDRWIQKLGFCDMIASGSLDHGNALEMRSLEIANDTAGGPWRLADVLEDALGGYDFVLLDTPPNMGPLTVNALCAATDLIIPCDMDIQSIKGFDVFLGYVRQFQRRMNRKLVLAGVVMTQFRVGVNSARETLEGMRLKCAYENVKLFRSTVRSTDVVKRAHKEGIGIYEAVKSRRGSSRIDIDYDALIDEYLDSVSLPRKIA